MSYGASVVLCDRTISEHNLGTDIRQFYIFNIQGPASSMFVCVLCTSFFLLIYFKYILCYEILKSCLNIFIRASVFWKMLCYNIFFILVITFF